jgi:uncharacterized protein YggE
MRTFLVGIVAALGAAVAAGADEKRAQQPSITVAGTGEVSATPDLAHIQVGVVTQAKSAAAALKDNNAAMDNLFKAIAAHGITEKDVQTSNISVTPQYRPIPPGAPGRERQPEIIGYQVTNQVQLKVRKLTTLGPVLDDLVQKGANQVHGISFGFADPQQLMDRARRKAIADARRKADLYAEAADVRIGQVLSIEEAPQHARMASTFQLVSTGGGSVPIAAGEQQLHATVTVTYALTK